MQDILQIYYLEDHRNAKVSTSIANEKRMVIGFFGREDIIFTVIAKPYWKSNSRVYCIYPFLICSSTLIVAPSGPSSNNCAIKLSLQTGQYRAPSGPQPSQTANWTLGPSLPLKVMISYKSMINDNFSFRPSTIKNWTLRPSMPFTLIGLSVIYKW